MEREDGDGDDVWGTSQTSVSSCLCVGLGLQVLIEAVGVGHGHLELVTQAPSISLLVVAETRLPCFAPWPLGCLQYYRSSTTASWALIHR